MIVISVNRKRIRASLLIGILMAILIQLSISYKANAESSEFEIENGVLISYSGKGGDITIPDSVISIRDFAFYRNNTITSVTIPNSVTSIGIEAFWNCTNLSKIEIPKSVTHIGSDAFSSTPWMESQQRRNPLVVINDILVNGYVCEGSVVIGNNVKSICTHAFASNTKMTKITLSNTVTSIGSEAFAGCINIKTVVMKDSVTKLGEGAFCYCKSLAYVKLSNSLVSIPKGSFEKCYKLVNITIPYSVKKINTAFDGCKKLKSITISSRVTEINKAVFDYCNKPVIYGIKNSYAYKFAKKYGITFKTLSVSKEKISLSVGDVNTLRLNSSAICTWKSSNNSIVTVDSKGNITAVKKGSVMIKAYLYKKTYTFKVEVK